MKHPYRTPGQPAREPAPADRIKEWRRAGVIAFIAAAVGATPIVGAIVEGCTPQQGQIIITQVPADILADIECATAQLLQGGLADPMQIITQCGGLLASQLLALIDGLLAAPSASDAGTIATARAMLPPRFANILITETQRSRLLAIRAQVVALVDGGH